MDEPLIFMEILLRILGVSVIILVLIGFVYVTRRFWLWYWKIDRRIGLLEKIEINTRHNSNLGS